MMKVRERPEFGNNNSSQSNGIEVEVEECLHPAKKPNLGSKTDLECHNEEGDLSVILESDTEALGHQIAGHDRIGILKHKLGYVLKPLQKEPFGSREVNFYKKVFSNENPDGKPAKNQYSLLQTLLPKFHGMTKIQSFEDKVPIWKEYLMLEDIIEGFTNPCVMDIKVGAQTWDPNASQVKIEHEKSKYKGTKGPLGLSITGMQHFDIKTQKTIKMEKELGKKLVESSFIDTIKVFLNRAYSENNPEFIAKRLIERLKVIKEYFEVQREFHFYSSSLLIAYDAKKLQDLISLDLKQNNANSKGSDSIANNDNENVSSWLRVWMIDFAHVFPAVENKADENYLFGLNNLIRICEDMTK